MFHILHVDPCPLRYRFTLRDEKDVKLHIQGLFLSSEGPRKWSAALILCAFENTDQTRAYEVEIATSVRDAKFILRHGFGYRISVLPFLLELRGSPIGVFHH